MLLIDNLLLAPVQGLMFVFREIHGAVEAERHDTRGAVQDLQELYMRLETGRITEEEFSRHEAGLLDRLDRADGGEGGP